MDQISVGRALLGVLVFLVLLRLLNFVAGRDKLAGWLFTLEWGALVVTINCALAQMGEIPVWVSAANISVLVVGVVLALFLAWNLLLVGQSSLRPIAININPESIFIILLIRSLRLSRRVHRRFFQSCWIQLLYVIPRPLRVIDLVNPPKFAVFVCLPSTILKCCIKSWPLPFRHYFRSRFG